jgi:hypothetical protein
MNLKIILTRSFIGSPEKLLAILERTLLKSFHFFSLNKKYKASLSRLSQLFCIVQAENYLVVHKTITAKSKKELSQAAELTKANVSPFPDGMVTWRYNQISKFDYQITFFCFTFNCKALPKHTLFLLPEQVFIEVYFKQNNQNKIKVMNDDNESYFAIKNEQVEFIPNISTPLYHINEVAKDSFDGISFQTLLFSLDFSSLVLLIKQIKRFFLVSILTEKLKKINVKQFKKPVLLALFLSVGYLASTSAYLYFSLESAKKQQENLRSEVNQLFKTKSLIEKNAKTNAQLAQGLQGSKNLGFILRQLQSKLSEKDEINTIILQNDQLVLIGVSDNANVLLRQLRSIPMFENATHTRPLSQARNDQESFAIALISIQESK